MNNTNTKGKGNRLKVAMEIAFMVSAAGVATILHNAPASAASDNSNSNGNGNSSKVETYVPTDYTGLSNGQQIKNISGTAKAQVLKQITSASAGTLDFGKVVPTAASGTITVAADGSITNAGGARYIPNSGAKVATLTFAGEPNQAISIDTPSTATIKNGANSMTVSFQYPTIPTTIGSSGTVSMNYGGVLNVGANQAAGIYSGTYDIYVTYV